MVKDVKKSRVVALLAALVAVFVLSVVGAFGFVPTSARAQESFAQTANWDFTGNTIEEVDGGIKILAGQARYKEPLPIGDEEVESITVRFEYLGLYSKGWLGVGFSPKTELLGGGGMFWPQNSQTVGIFPVLNAENGTKHRVFVYPENGYLCDFEDDLKDAAMGMHTLSLIKNDDNTLSVCLDGKINPAKSAKSVADYADADGNIYLHIDDTESVGVNVYGVTVNKKGTFAGGSVIDSELWNKSEGDKASNGTELYLSGGQSVFKKGIDFGASTFKSVKLKFRLANGNDWASVGFARSKDILGAGGHFWGSGSPGVYFIIGQKTAGQSTQSHIHCKGNSPTELDSFEITDDRIAGEHTIELKKNADGTLSAYLDGVKASQNSFALSEITGEESSLLYLHADDANGDQIVIKQLVINDERGPAIAISGEAPSEGRTGEELTLPSATAVDAVDGEREITVKVYAPDDTVGTQIESDMKFTPEVPGEHTVEYRAADLSENETVLNNIKITVESSADMPVLTVGTWEEKNYTVGDKIIFPEATATLADEPVDVVMTLKLPDGSEQALALREYVAETVGQYTLEYSAEGRNDKVAVKEITFVVLPKLTSDDATDPEVFSNPVYWNSNANTTNLESAEQNGGIIVNALDRAKGAAANYLIPVSMLDRVKIFYTVKSGGNWVSFALTKEPVAVNDFDAVQSSKPHNTDGIYFMMSGAAYNITCTNKRQFTYLGDSQLVTAYPFEGSHTLEFIRGNAGFMLKLDGVTCSSGALANVPHETFINEKDETYLSIGSKNVTAVQIDRITTQADDDAPIIDYTEDVNAFVGNTFDIPQLTAKDNIDGPVPVYYTVYDAYGRVCDLDDGQTQIELVFEGEWRIEYSAYDSSGNKASFTLTLYVEANPELPGFWLNGTPAPNGRTGVEYALPMHNVDDGGTVTVTVSDPSGKITDITEAPKFTPEVIGLYTVTYTVSNSAGDSYQALYFVNVKINADINETMTPEVFNSTENWVQNTENTLENTQDGLLIKGTKAYYKYPLDMSIGVVFNIRLDALYDKLQKDNWLGVALMPKAGYGDFANYSQTGIYMMFYNNGGTLRYNVSTLNAAGIFVFAADGVIGTYEDGMNLSVKLMKYSGGNAQYFDNVVLYLNGMEVKSAAMDNVHYSEIVDDENFTFVCFSRFGSTTPEESRVTVLSAKIADVIKPVITLPEYPADVKLGDVIDLSQITFSDNEDTELSTEIRIQTPDGFILLGDRLKDGKLTFDTAGKYVITITARDSAGNFEFAIVNVNVATVKEKGCRCAAGMGTGSVVASVAVAAVVLAVIMRKKSLRKRGKNERI